MYFGEGECPVFGIALKSRRLVNTLTSSLSNFVLYIIANPPGFAAFILPDSGGDCIVRYFVNPPGLTALIQN